MSGLTLKDCAIDFVLQANRVVSVAEEVQAAVERDDLDAAILVVGMSHNKIAELNDSMREMQRQLDRAGADWKRALGRDD